ncbi:uncharacterized protein J4E84_008341 [Alternaria hordeiaustralica]|uniref:uncharacterized protein n=1 Tax=Alternaria hordeiaustralica TaxID=1187925 RepID=UPI0020C31227|nr:uncharacterized protein J4E84_008341 [Alternaria hordeiaustralica]KAI4679313.1 hypothetical protein J4E84_008341 [Alternaria hordeiaustralica]
MTATKDYTGGLGYCAAGLSGEDLWPVFDGAWLVAASAKYGLSGIDMRFGMILAKLGNVICTLVSGFGLS